MFGMSVKSPHSTSAVIDAFDSVLHRFIKNGATAEQLDIAKRAIGMEYVGHLSSNQSLALDFATSQLAYGTWKASIEWYDLMMKVTVEDIKRVAEKYLVADQRTIATIERAR
jgi:predicted Zn-dependent peptidase